MLLQVSAAVRKIQEEVEARQKAEAEAARLAEETRIRVCTSPPLQPCMPLLVMLCLLGSCCLQLVLLLSSFTLS